MQFDYISFKLSGLIHNLDGEGCSSSSSSSSSVAVFVRTLAASHQRLRNLVKTLGRTPLDKWSARRKGLSQHRTTQHRNTKTNIYASSRIQTHDPSNQAENLRLRPRGHWDRHEGCYTADKLSKSLLFFMNFFSLVLVTLSLSHNWRSEVCALMVPKLLQTQSKSVTRSVRYREMWTTQHWLYNRPVFCRLRTLLHIDCNRFFEEHRVIQYSHASQWHGSSLTTCLNTFGVYVNWNFRNFIQPLQNPVIVSSDWQLTSFALSVMTRRWYPKSFVSSRVQEHSFYLEILI
jgi:hypothetical protein